MKEITIPISSLSKMDKYLRVLIGKYAWRVNAFACIDHSDYSPVLVYWMSHGKKSRQNIEHPKLVNCFLTGEYVPSHIRKGVEEALAESEDYAFVEESLSANKIKKIAENILNVFQTEDDLIREVLDIKNLMYFGTYGRILTYASYLYLRENVNLENALLVSEEKFDTYLKNRNLFFQYWENTKCDDK